MGKKALEIVCVVYWSLDKRIAAQLSGGCDTTRVFKKQWTAVIVKSRIATLTPSSRVESALLLLCDTVCTD